MRSATRLGLAAVALGAWSAPARAQDPNVTFQVDMTPYITSCQFEPATDVVTIPGNFNEWNTGSNAIADDNGDGVYAGTFPFAAGTELLYKFYASSALGWEDKTGDRAYTVTSDPNQTIPLVTFADPPPVDECGAGGTAEDYEIVFTVDMRVQIASGNFDPETETVAVAGAITDWGTSPVNLPEDPFETGVYTALVNGDSIVVPGTTPYKFVIRDAGGVITTWESGADRTVELTGSEPDADSDGRREAAAPRRFFDDVTFDDVLDQPATVAFEVDLRPAYYALLDNGSLPTDAAGGGALTSFSTLSINGPFAGAANENVNGIEDWSSWGPSSLGSIPERQLNDGGANGDLVAGDSVWTLTYNYDVGTARRLVGKMGVDGYDNEAAFGNDQNIAIAPGTQRLRYVFGAMRRADGTYNDLNGPGPGAGVPLYDPYIVIDNTATPPTVAVVRRGGSVANEPGGPPAVGLSLGANYPNPASGRTQFEFTLDRAQPVAIRVYDVTGRAVATLVEGTVAAGTHTATFDAGRLPSGLYLYRLEADGTTATGRMTVVR